MYTVVLGAALLGACGTNLTPPAEERPPGQLDCLPNLDGTIEIGELPLVTEAKGSYWVSSVETPVDVIGTELAGGERRWDWSVVATSDQLVEVETQSLAGAWFAASFPTGELVAPLDLDHTLVGVLVRDAQTISLLGFASTTPDPAQGQTLVIYDAPVPLYVFPIIAGAHWSSTGMISPGHGTINGLPFVGANHYDVTVAATGQLDLPELTFTQAYQLRMEVAVQPSAGPATTFRTASFLFECFGEVGRATSRVGETSSAFRIAREVRRFGFR